MSLIERIDEISSKRNVKKGWFGLILFLFVFFIILPSVFVLFEIVPEWSHISVIIGDSGKMSVMLNAVLNSFSIAFIVTILDIIVGLPMAWIMVRKQFKAKKYLDTLIDMPLAFPTAALGFSVVMFWGCPNGIDIPGLGLVLSPYLMLILLHLIFTYPYMVRSLSGILEQINPNYETAGMTLGASRFTAVRTITLPLFRAGLITGFILCFARSLSETGGTYIALKLMGFESSFFTGPTYIKFLKDMPGTDATPDLILVSSILIICAIVLLLVAKHLMSSIKIPWSKVWPRWERKISRGIAARGKDIFTYLFFFVIILVPSFFIFTFLTASGSAPDVTNMLSAIGTSFLVAGVAVVFDIIFGIPMAIYIARNGHTRLGRIMDTMINIPLIIPTTALGFSLGLFWGELNMGSLSILLVIFGHIAFTYPLMVRNIIGAIEEVDPSYEEIARTLGAKPLQAFRKVLLPIIQSSVIAGGILAFTRSLGETGATKAIADSVITVPIYIVNFIDSGEYYPAAVSAIVLIVICFLMMFSVRFITRRKGGSV